MFSKNNKDMRQTQVADRLVPHYSLRKLGIGVVSVLLGTTMYFGAGNTVANADEVTSGSNANDDAGQTGASVQNTGKVVAINNTNTAAQSTAVASTAQNSQAAAVSATSSISDGGGTTAPLM